MNSSAPISLSTRPVRRISSTGPIHFFLAAYLPSLAHSQIDNLSLIQIVSITGMGGLVFLIYWFAGTLNRVWESGFEWTLAKREGGIFLSALILTVVYGDTRLAFAKSQPETLQVAMINLQRNRLGSLDNFDPEIVRELFAASKKAVAADAKVIVWAEANAAIPHSYEDELIKLGKAFAKENQYAFTALNLFYPRSGLASDFHPPVTLPSKAKPSREVALEGEWRSLILLRP